MNEQDYEEFLRKYMAKHKIPREEAEKHLIVMIYRRECERREDPCEKISQQE